MTLKTSLAVAAAGLLAATSLANAEVARPYITLGAGLSFLQDSDVSGGGRTATVGANNPGWALMGAAGIGIFNNVRTELELSHRENSLDNVSGSAEADSIMLNLYYDIPLRLAGFTPYIGAGVGSTWINVDNANTIFGRIDDRDRNWAYQGIVGVATDVTPNMKFTMDYRYLSTFDDPEFSSSGGTRVSGEYKDHVVMVGLRWSFGGASPAPAPMATPAAAPAPAPAPAPAREAASPLVRSFLVFFDFNRSDITSDARQVITQAADNARKAGGTSRITLTGHADRSGSAQYNLRLSQRRAEAVKAELVRMGVPANDIATVAKGETDPLVQTPDGVREPRNRRVEIVF